MLLLSPLGTKRVGPSIQDLSDLPTAEHKERRRQLGECFQRKIDFFLRVITGYRLQMQQNTRRTANNDKTIRYS